MMKHVCKLCDKRFPCGRSLGGHMRSHVLHNSAQVEVEAKPNTEMESSSTEGRNSKGENEIEANEQSGYGLRQNPKKTWRLVDSKTDGKQEMFCKECGKGFQSLKALCGHMACHSERERVLNNVEDHSWTNANQKPVMDSQSDTETVAPRRQRRSKRLRCKTLTVKYSPTSTFSMGNGSSTVSEIEQEQEEVAMCLMMLSRDSGNWGGFNSVVDSSDNNSVVLEARSMSIDMRIGMKENPSYVYNGDEIVEMKKTKNKKLKSGVFDAESVYLENSDSGYLNFSAKKIESDAFDNGIYKNGEIKKFEVKGGSRFKVSNGEMGKGAKKLKRSKIESVKDLIKDEGYNYRQANKKALMKKKSENPARNDFHKSELWGVSLENKAANGPFNTEEICRKAQKRSKFECLIYNKSFHSPQALGGHIASHKKINNFSASAYESGENSVETDISLDPRVDYKLNNFSSGKELIDEEESGNAEKNSVSKKVKKHECPVCFKVFRSGQALGGHKRIHLAGGSEEKGNRNPVIKLEHTEVSDLLDLNLPAPTED